MADIKLRENLFTSGYSGEIKGDVGLSWADSMALHSMAASAHQAAHSAWETSQETRRARQALESIDYSLDEVASGIASLEVSLGLKLDEQTRVLESQAQILDEIRRAVLTPAKTRAAERVADASQLLRNQRYERALKVAEEGIDADPNNPGVFFAAGWALVGLKRFEEAQQMFEEARDAATGNERSRAARQAARAAFVSGRDEVAYALVRDARQMVESSDERAAVAYDIAVYAWANDQHEEAHEAMRAACEHDTRYGAFALADRALDGADALRDTAAGVVADRAEAVAEQRPAVERHVEVARAAVPERPRDMPRWDAILSGLRPSTDADETRGQVISRIDAAEDDLRRVADAVNLQHSLSLLKSADAKLEEAEQLVPALTQQIEAQTAAAGLQRTKERNNAEAEAAVRKYGGYMVSANKILSRKSTFLWLGGVLVVIGLIGVTAALPLGLILLLVPAVAYGVYKWAEPQRAAAYKTGVDYMKLGR